MTYDVVIIGCGASGIAAAIEIRKNSNLSVAIIEQNDKPLKKVLKTGNGKCNIFNRNIIKSKYNDFRLINNVDLDTFFNEIGLIVKTDNEGRVYPYSETSTSVVNILLSAIKRYDIKLYTNAKVFDLCKNKDLFKISFNDQYVLAKKVVCSTGSISQEKTNGYSLLETLGHSCLSLRPGLVNLITKEKTNHLKGIRVKCACYVNKQYFKGELLFKDDGLSGIIAFDLSRIINEKTKLSFDLAPDLEKSVLIKHLEKNENLELGLLGLLPKMVALDVLKRAGNNIEKIAYVIKNYTFEVIDRGTFNNSQITLGGIRLDEINGDFSSKFVEGLYIIGEVLDVDGACGGYNLYFAWSSGIVCGRSIVALFN